MINFTQALRGHIYAEMKAVFSGDTIVAQESPAGDSIGRVINDKHIQFRALGAHEDEIKFISALALLHANGVVPIPRDNHA